MTRQVAVNGRDLYQPLPPPPALIGDDAVLPPAEVIVEALRREARFPLLLSFCDLTELPVRTGGKHARYSHVESPQRTKYFEKWHRRGGPISWP